MAPQSTEQVITSAQAALFHADVACVPPHVFHCFTFPRGFILPDHSFKRVHYFLLYTSRWTVRAVALSLSFESKSFRYFLLEPWIWALVSFSGLSSYTPVIAACRKPCKFYSSLYTTGKTSSLIHWSRNPMKLTYSDKTW